MKIFNGEILKNPCDGCRLNDRKCNKDECYDATAYNTQLSILNQCKEINLNVMWQDYHYYRNEWHDELSIMFHKGNLLSFEQFIQSEIKKQESDHV
jgi:hypothetical protein